MKKYAIILPGNSGAVRMRPKRPWPPPKQTLSDFCWCFVNFQVLEFKRRWQSDSRQCHWHRH